MRWPLTVTLLTGRCSMASNQIGAVSGVVQDAASMQKIPPTMIRRKACTDDPGREWAVVGLFQLNDGLVGLDVVAFRREDG